MHLNDNLKSTSEKGAALVTTLVIATLLLTAAVSMLIALGANARNATDVLSETKAYYSAESGLQATINTLRNRSPKLKYSEAAANPSLDSYLTYNYQSGTSNQRVVLGVDSASYNPALHQAYSVNVRDPDGLSNDLRFNTTGQFSSNAGVTLSGDGRTVYIPNATASDRTVIQITTRSSTTIDFLAGGIPGYNQLGGFTLVETFGNGGAISASDSLKFQFSYNLESRRTGSKTIYGSITKAAGAPPIISFGSQAYELYGSTIELCAHDVNGPNCPDVGFSLTTVGTEVRFGAYITPLEPMRLLVLSKGFGPNGAKKELEAVIRKNLSDIAAPEAATTMIGPAACPASYPNCLGYHFVAGQSTGVTYSGGDCQTTGCVPSFGLTDPTIEQYVESRPPGCRPNESSPCGNPAQMQPPPEVLTSVPFWQQSVEAMRTFVNEQRMAAQDRGRYFLASAGSSVNVPNNPGDFNTGTGITFCEGSCRVGGNGGGTLVVTGKLTNLGGFSFRGLIIVVGEEGWERNGGGDGQIIGNVVISPYNRMPYVPAETYLSTTFLPPRYYISGGGGSDVIYGDLSTTFGTTDAFTDLMMGIVEK